VTREGAGSISFDSLGQVLAASRSLKQHVAATSGESGNPRSFYNSRTRRWQAEDPSIGFLDQERSLSFDTSNNEILASLDCRGTMQVAVVLRGATPAYFGDLVGVYVDKDMVHSSQWDLTLEVDGWPAIRLGSAEDAETRWLGCCLPWTRTLVEGVSCDRVTFAPIGAGGKARPRAIITLVRLSAPPERGVSGAIAAGPTPTVEAGEQGLVEVWAIGDRAAGQEARFELGQGEAFEAAFGLAVASSAAEAEAIVAAVDSRTAHQWLHETLVFHAGRLGSLSIQDEPYHAEAIVRQSELSRQSVLRLPDGRLGGGFWGSDVNRIPSVWMKDNFYAMLAMAYHEPDLCSEAIEFFVRWGMPPAAWGHRARGREIAPVTHSLGNALSALVLSGAYYQTTGDIELFEGHPEILGYAREVLDQMLNTRIAETNLYPSLYISDGDARGEVHTGSNVLAWFALHSMARIAVEAYGETVLADRWQQAAEATRTDLFHHCARPGVDGPEFFEGVYLDAGVVPGHDAEESDLTLASFYGLVEADDPAITNHARHAFSTSNPSYDPGVGPSWWHETLGWCGTSYPGYVHALAGARSEEEIALALETMRALTDLDGSPWWWSHTERQADFSTVRRTPGKCGWGAGVFLCRVITDVIGLRVDVPARTVAFRPFHPWRALKWSGCQVGRALFDLVSTQARHERCASLTNRMSWPVVARVEITLPPGHVANKVTVNGRDGRELARLGIRYGRSTSFVVQEVLPGQSVELVVEHAPVVSRRPT
jgi:hypothetical protein